MSTELVICPEGLRIAEAYLENGSDIKATASHLGLPVSQVEAHLNKGEVKRYIDRLFYEAGFRNRDTMGALLDEIVKQKLEEMQETGMGSNKDIMDILETVHKMKMKEMEMEIKLRQSETPTITVNTQNNYGGDRYNAFLEKLTG